MSFVPKTAEDSNTKHPKRGNVGQNVFGALGGSQRTLVLH